MTNKDIEQLFKAQSQLLVKLQPHISRKLGFALEEKIKLQEQQLQQLLGQDKKQTDNLSKYTLVLDSQYFDQIFLS